MAKYDTSAYDNMYKEYEKEQLNTADKQKQQTTADYNQQLKQAYINKMQNQKTLSDNMSNLGIRGGASETATLNNNLSYQNTRNTLNSSKMQALQTIDDNANANILSYKQTNDAAKQSYIEQREAEDRQIAQSKKETEEERKYEEQNNYWTSKYSKYYSEKSLKKALAKAKTSREKAIINARIGYLREHKKGY